MPSTDELRSELLDEVFKAIASYAELVPYLIFKGARVLNARLKTTRQSLDLDGNLSASFVTDVPDREDQRTFLQRHLLLAVSQFFESQALVRYTLDDIKTVCRPRQDHKFGWNAFVTTLSVRDASASELLSVSVELMSPEELSEESFEGLNVDGHKVQAYTLQRIAGEKLRAFLTSLPEHRKKLGIAPMVVRSKDLYDIAIILRTKPISDLPFWRAASKDFRLACQSRFVDCIGRETFFQSWNVTRATYESDPRLKDVPFEEAETSLQTVIAFLEETNTFPICVPIP